MLTSAATVFGRVALCPPVVRLTVRHCPDLSALSAFRPAFCPPYAVPARCPSSGITRLRKPLHLLELRTAPQQHFESRLLEVDPLGYLPEVLVSCKVRSTAGASRHAGEESSSDVPAAAVADDECLSREKGRRISVAV